MGTLTQGMVDLAEVVGAAGAEGEGEGLALTGPKATVKAVTTLVNPLDLVTLTMVAHRDTHPRLTPGDAELDLVAAGVAETDHSLDRGLMDTSLDLQMIMRRKK